MNSFHVAGNPGCVRFITVGRWQSIDVFRTYVPNASTSDQGEFETSEQHRVILVVA